MLSLQPIGYVRTGKEVKFKALHQPLETAPEQHILEIVPGHNYEDGLRDLAGFSRIWLVWWFHKNSTWRPMVLPPRGPAIRRGVFATRSPHRPNALGVSPVQLLAVEKCRLILGPCDLMDGTPVFDIKPYIPAYDSFPDEKSGWIAGVDAALTSPPTYQISYMPEAEAQAAWLETTWQIDFRPRLEELLGRDPSPHRTRRIKRLADGTCTIGCGAWRARFEVSGHLVKVTLMEPGFPLRFLHREGNELIPDRLAQLDFLRQWPLDS